MTLYPLKATSGRMEGPGWFKARYRGHGEGSCLNQAATRASLRQGHSDGQLFKLVSAARHLLSCLDVYRRSEWYNCLTYHSKQNLPSGIGLQEISQWYSLYQRILEWIWWRTAEEGVGVGSMEERMFPAGFGGHIRLSVHTLVVHGHVGNGIIIVFFVLILIMIPGDDRDPIPGKSSQVSLQVHILLSLFFLNHLIITNPLNPASQHLFKGTLLSHVGKFLSL